MNKLFPFIFSAFYFFMLLSPIKSSAQDTVSERDKITKTLNNYFEGYIERDSLKLYEAFDTENGTMKVPIMEDQEIVGFENKYFKDLMPKWSNREKLSAEDLKHCRLDILNIDLESDQMASAKISMKVVDVTYIDIVSLQRINGIWKITNKIYIVKK